MGEESSLAELLEHGDLTLTSWEDDEIALRVAACSGRHPFNEMTSLEKRCFEDIHEDKASLQVYLYIRNKIVSHFFYFEKF